jgi:hypothetical protein
MSLPCARCGRPLERKDVVTWRGVVTIECTDDQAAVECYAMQSRIEGDPCPQGGRPSGTHASPPEAHYSGEGK